MVGTLVIKPGREKSLLRRHPWIFSGAVGEVRGSPGAGETVEVVDKNGQFLAWAAYSPHSQIRARVWTWDVEETVDEAFLHRRLKSAWQARQMQPGLDATNAMRIVHGESDGLPGLVLDRYDDVLVAQLLSAGAEYWRDALADLALEITGGGRVYERSDVDVRQLEGLEMRSGLLRGAALDGPVEVFENAGAMGRAQGIRFWVDVHEGHKTGFYLDQRRNRAQVGLRAEGKDVLDCFSYTGGFTAYALAGGARAVLSVDASTSALTTAQQNLALNDLPLERVIFQEGDVFQVLRTLRDQARSFDLIVLDPPKFAQTASQAQRAARGYKDINLLALKLLRPGGILATFSCSGGVSEDLFQKILAGAALDAGVEARIHDRLFQDVDHPVGLNFPEGAYLKGLIISKT